MTIRVLQGEPPVEITLKRSARARRYSLRVSRLDGRVTLSMPPGGSEREALGFVRTKEAWLRQVLEQASPVRAVVPGASLPFEGREVLLAPGAVRAARIEGDTMIVPADPDRAARAAAVFLKHAARARLQAASDHYAGLLGRGYARLTLRDTRSRWGSCTADGGLMYSWRLIMAPPEVLAYVAAHEVAHLAEMNHSPAFWAVVARLSPDYRVHRRWLRQHGAGLHLFDFSGLRGGD